MKLVGLSANSQKQPGGNNPGSAKFSPLEPALGISPGSASSSNSEVIVKVGGASRDAEVVPPPPLSWHVPGIGGEVGQSWIPAKPASTLQWLWN